MNGSMIQGSEDYLLSTASISLQFSKSVKLSSLIEYPGSRLVQWPIAQMQEFAGRVVPIAKDICVHSISLSNTIPVRLFMRYVNPVIFFGIKCLFELLVY